MKKFINWFNKDNKGIDNLNKEIDNLNQEELNKLQLKETIKNNQISADLAKKNSILAAISIIISALFSIQNLYLSKSVYNYTKEQDKENSAEKILVEYVPSYINPEYIQILKDEETYDTHIDTEFRIQITNNSKEAISISDFILGNAPNFSIKGIYYIDKNSDKEYIPCNENGDLINPIKLENNESFSMMVVIDKNLGFLNHNLNDSLYWDLYNLYGNKYIKSEFYQEVLNNDTSILNRIYGQENINLTINTSKDTKFEIKLSIY